MRAPAPGHPVQMICEDHLQCDARWLVPPPHPQLEAGDWKPPASPQKSPQILKRGFSFTRKPASEQRGEDVEGVRGSVDPSIDDRINSSN
jgi:hypothetical protein